jgi:type I restriction enzyme S subunit
MQIATKTTPLLRFPEFEEDWCEVRLGEFLVPTLRAVAKPAERFRALGIRSHCRGTFQRQSLDPEDISMDTLYVVNKNDFIVNITFAWEGAIAIAKAEDDGGLVSHRFPTYIFNEEITGPNFFQHVFVQGRFRYFLKVISPGGAGRNRVLDKKDFLKLAVRLPERPEQEKIAAFLSAVGEKIRQLVRKKELLLDYKKGVMQRIFDLKIRFKDDDGNDFPDWQPRRFDELFSFVPTNSFSREDLNYDEGTVKNIHYGDIHTKFRPLFDVEREKVPFINKDIRLNGISDGSYCKEGDLVFADASEDYADVGKCVEISNLNGERVVAGLHTLLARPKDKFFASGFAGYAMKSWALRWQIMREAQGTKVLGISAGRLSKIKLSLPSVLEQQKIASFISSLDERIEIVQQQIESTQAFKKALLQQMFV